MKTKNCRKLVVQIMMTFQGLFCFEDFTSKSQFKNEYFVLQSA